MIGFALSTIIVLLASLVAALVLLVIQVRQVCYEVLGFKTWLAEFRVVLEGFGAPPAPDQMKAVVEKMQGPSEVIPAPEDAWLRPPDYAESSNGPQPEPRHAQPWHY